jgi:hypothetical protein
MPRQQVKPASGTTETLITAYGGEVGLPAGLTLSGPMQAKLLPDGRLFLVDLHPSVQARLYPDLVSWSPEETPEPKLVTPGDDPDAKGE